MQAKPLFVLGALVLAAGSVLAAGPADSNAPLTRAEVRQAVIDARAAGELRPAGEYGDEAFAPALAPHSTLTRADVERQVVAARAAGLLAPAGEAGDDAYPPVLQSTGPGLSRVEVVAATRQARDEGRLIPAGQGDSPAEEARTVSQHQYAVAHEHHAATTATN